MAKREGLGKAGCPSCGVEVRIGNAFCTSCGERVAPEAESRDEARVGSIAESLETAARGEASEKKGMALARLSISKI